MGALVQPAQAVRRAARCVSDRRQRAGARGARPARRLGRTSDLEAVRRADAGDARRRAGRHERGARRRVRDHERPQVPRRWRSGSRIARCSRRLERHEDTLTGLHANTQIPKAIGYARIAELGGDPAGLDAAKFFWQTVVRHRTVAFGGNSVREHFNPADDFSSMIESREGPETCNTYNMLRLTERLFRAEPSAEYADFYERAVFNHILSTEHPVHGGFVYFTPIRPRHYRVYSQPSQCFWCCVGTGMENHGKYGQFIYAHTRRRAVREPVHRVGAALAGTRRSSCSRRRAFPTSRARGSCSRCSSRERFTLRVRHPSWVAAGGFAIRVNGQPWPRATRRRPRMPRSPASGGTATASRSICRCGRRSSGCRMGRITWRSCTGRSCSRPKPGTEQLDGLIAGDGRMAHVSPGPYLPLDSAPMLVGDVATFAGSHPSRRRPADDVHGVRRSFGRRRRATSSSCRSFACTTAAT